MCITWQQSWYEWSASSKDYCPDSKVYGTNMGPIWDRQDPGGPHVGPWTLLSGDLPFQVLVGICTMSIDAWHFQINVLEWKCMKFEYIFIRMFSSGSNSSQVNIGSCNDLVPSDSKQLFRDSEITASCIIYPLNLKQDSSATNYLCILKFPMNKIISDGTHCHGSQGPMRK